MKGEDALICCCVCCEGIIGTGWVCRECANTWNLCGVKFANLPEWVKAAKNFEQTERRQDDEDKGLGLIFASKCLAVDILFYGGANTDLIP